MTEKTLTTENIRPALDALRGELAPWPVVAMKQDKLNDTQKSAVNSGITSSLVAQITANTAAIRALESAITGTGLRALVVSSLPAVGTLGILYIVPVTTYDPETDADVVNYSNEYLWIVAPDAPVTEGYYEQVGQTGIVINNGQLTITVNGTSVGTFTANQSGDTTAAITVPTNADYVDRTTNQTIAGTKTFTSTIDGTAAKAIADEDGTSIKTGYVNVAGNQIVTGDKSFTGSNTFNNILPNATNTYSLGSSSYQWSSVYAQTYYYNGTQWGLDQNNTWTGYNTFSAGVLTNTVEPSTGNTGLLLRSTDQTWENGARIFLYSNTQTGQTNGSIYVDVDHGDNNNTKTGLTLVPNAFHPIGGTVNTTYGVSLGTATYQWAKVYSEQYYYNGTAWGLDKANVWTGNNQFNESIDISKSTNAGLRLINTALEISATKGQPDLTSDVVPFISFKSKNYEHAIADFSVTANTTSTKIRFVSRFYTNSSTYAAAGFDVYASTASKYLAPTDNNTVDLGTSTNKWKSLNGINPGALSLPDVNISIAVDTTNWVYDGATFNEIKINNATQTISGWLYIIINNASSDDVIVVRYAGSDSGNLTYAQYKSGLSYVSLVAPIMPGVKTYVASRKAFSTIKIYSCLGNV